MNDAKNIVLYIIRHAEAGQRGDPRYPDDSQRPLTKEGRKRFRCLAKKLAKRDFAPTLIATSPFVRCRQTAEVLLQLVPVKPELVELHELEPGSQLDSLLTWTAGQKVQEMVWVGHATDVNRLAGELIGARSEAIHFAKGAVAAIEFHGRIARQEGWLRWLITAKVLGC